MKDKTLILVRGIPGSGKTTFAEMMNNGPVISADHYFEIDGKYKYNVNESDTAHYYCEKVTEMCMNEGKKIIYVANTLTTEKEMDHYFKLAQRYDYNIITIIIENRHNSKDIHNVPEEIIEKMKTRFNIKL